MVVTGTDTEVCFLTTTTDGHIVVLAKTPLGDSVTPVGVVTILTPLGEVVSVVQVVDFRDALLVRGVIILTGVEVGLFQHHGVVVTAEQVITLRLVGTREFQ